MIKWSSVSFDLVDLAMRFAPDDPESVVVLFTREMLGGVDDAWHRAEPLTDEVRVLALPRSLIHATLSSGGPGVEECVALLAQPTAVHTRIVLAMTSGKYSAAVVDLPGHTTH